MKTHSVVIRQFVYNKDRRFGSANQYIPALYFDGEKYTPMLFTRADLDEPIRRGDANPEDVLKPSWLARLAGWLSK